ncbi:MAG: Hsp20/alpha crystallin family protein [Vampirovibrionales bacterium]|nr:Hsp20/alpha crystallin family protein [Vampirovibrionales bacterium]
MSRLFPLSRLEDVAFPEIGYDFSALKKQIDSVFSSMLPSEARMALTSGMAFMPEAEILETPEAYRVKLALPGLDPKIIKDNIHVQVSARTVTIQGDVHKKDEETVQNTLLMSQFSYGKFRRQFTFSEALEPANVRAHYQQGVLDIELPKAQKTTQKPIDIQIRA